MIETRSEVFDARDATPEDVADPDTLPVPSGWRILVRPIPPQEQTKGGIILSDVTRDQQEFACPVGKVVAVGTAAYTREDMGPEPWANVGDYVIFGKYVGERVTYGGVKYVLMNDDCVLGVVPDPQKVYWD